MAGDTTHVDELRIKKINNQEADTVHPSSPPGLS